ncbi:MAG: thiamine pyrophosphate-requiring protein [Nannocystis sp.]|nr:thiamine pyrophosphate-requiring protein [Nannocystis sp.]
MSLDRELVVFLPAVGGDPSFWAPQLRALAPAYDTLALDLTRPAAEVSMAGFADDVAAAIERAGYLRAHVVGLSMGGVVALELLRRHRARVRSLTLANTWAYQADGEARYTWFSGQVDEHGLPGFSQRSLPGLFAPTTAPEIVRAGVAVESAKDEAMVRACWREMLRADLRPLLPTIDRPLLLIGGALDPVTPTDPLLTAIAEAVPCARLVQLGRAAHFSNLDDPDAFTAALRAHLRGARGRGDDRLDPPPFDPLVLPAGSAAAQLLRLLDLHGVELLAANSGTDFTPIIDALAERGGDPTFALRVVTCPHENTAIALAHGHALLSRRPQAVMGHVGVGTANMGLGLINARRARVPIFVMAGTTPWYERGVPGARSNFVQWGQDTFDQRAMFREFTKWDYELRSPHALDTVVERGLAIAASDPQGPVYLTLPKEPLSAAAPARPLDRRPRHTPTRLCLPEPSAIEAAAAWIRAAERPLIVTADAGRHVGAPEALVRLAERAQIGVIEHGKRNFFNFPTEHPHHLGFEPLPFVAEADLILAVECPVPWIPSFGRMDAPPRVIQIGVDPLHADLPMRGFPCDLALSGDPAAILRALADHLPGAPAPTPPGRLRAAHEQAFHNARSRADAEGAAGRLTKSYLSRALGRVLDDDAVIFNEYDLDPWQVPRRCPDSWFENSVASGLGWSLGAALGAAIAAPERTIVVTLGDGSYYFNTPLSAHQVAAAEGIGLLIVVFNDQAWSTIKRSTRGSHPQGHAVRTGDFPLCDFAAPLDFAAVARAAGGVGLTLDHPKDAEALLQAALHRVRSERRLVLIDARCERDG